MHEHTDTVPDATAEATKAYIDKMNQGVASGKWIIWAIENDETHQVIGTISIWNFDGEQHKAELGYGLIPAAQGRGLMQEALTCVIDYGFSATGLEALEAYTEENHVKSCQLLKRAGFREAGRVDEKGFSTDRVYRMIVYRLENAQPIS